MKKSPLPKDTNIPDQAPVPPPEAPPAPQKQSNLPFIIILIIILFIGLNAVIYFYGAGILGSKQGTVGTLQGNAPAVNTPVTPPATPIPTPTPTPSYLPPGKHTISVSHGKGWVGPQIYTVTLEPLDPKKGEKQIITLTYTNSVNSSSLTFYSDNTKRVLPLTQTAPNVFTTTWTLDDTVFHRYILVSHATDNTGTSKDINPIRTNGQIDTTTL